MNEPRSLIQQLLDLPFEERKRLRDLLDESLDAERIADGTYAVAWTVPSWNKCSPSSDVPSQHDADFLKKAQS